MSTSEAKPSQGDEATAKALQKASAMSDAAWSWLIYYGFLGLLAFVLVSCVRLPPLGVEECATLTNLAQNPSDWAGNVFTPPTWTSAAARLTACDNNPSCRRCMDVVPALIGGSFTGLTQIVVSGLFFTVLYFLLVLGAEHVMEDAPSLIAARAQLTFY